MTNSSSHRYILERFEDNGWAVLEVEAGVTFNVPESWLPSGAEEGDVLVVAAEDGVEESDLHFAIDPVATEERRRSTQALRESFPNLCRR